MASLTVKGLMKQYKISFNVDTIFANLIIILITLSHTCYVE